MDLPYWTSKQQLLKIVGKYYRLHKPNKNDCQDVKRCFCQPMAHTPWLNEMEYMHKVVYLRSLINVLTRNCIVQTWTCVCPFKTIARKTYSLQTLNVKYIGFAGCVCKWYVHKQCFKQLLGHDHLTSNWHSVAYIKL